jgi:CHASE2 domain-containing sensor protein
VKAKLPDNFELLLVRCWASRWTLPLALFLGGALLLLIHENPLEIQEMHWLDQMLRWRAEFGLAPVADPHIVHLDLDTDDLNKPDVAAEYRNIADIIAEASDLGASVIVLDIVFGRGSRESAQPILDAIERAKSNNCSVVLAEFVQGPLEITRSFPFGERLRPSGLTNVQSDADGVFRRYAFVERGTDGLEPSLALAAFLAWRRVDWSETNRSLEKGIVSWTELTADSLALKRREASVEPVILNFRTDWDASGPGSLRHYSRARLHLLHSTRQSSPVPNAPPLENKIVIVSSVAAGVGDVGTTPLGTNQPKALVHSTGLNDLIQETSLVRVPPLLEAAAFSFILALVWATSLCRGTASMFLLWISGITAPLALGYALMATTGYVISSVFMGSLSTATVIGELARRYRAKLTAPANPPKPPPEPQKASEAVYDVFLAHNSQDKLAVLAVAAVLKRRGIRPWIDVEQIPPGRWFQDVIQAAILEVRSTAIFLGPGSLGRWQALEVRAFVSQCVERQIPVIPVLLPGVNEIPAALVFLRELNCVSFHRSPDEEEPLDRLVWGITGCKPG